MGGLNPLSPLCVHHCHQRQLPPFIAVYTLTDPLRPRPFRSLPTTTNRHDGHRLSTTAFVRTPHRYTQQVLRPMATPTNNPASTDHRVVSYLQCTPSLSLSLWTRARGVQFVQVWPRELDHLSNRRLLSDMSPTHFL